MPHSVPLPQTGFLKPHHWSLLVAPDVFCPRLNTSLKLWPLSGVAEGALSKMLPVTSLLVVVWLLVESEFSLL